MAESTSSKQSGSSDGSKTKSIKYMGIADKATLEKGETFGGQLPGGLSKKITFSWANNFVVDASGLSENEVKLILDDSERFVDVTDLEVVPLGQAQRTWKAMGHRPDPEVATAPEKPAEDEKPAGGASEVAQSPSTAGGSTAGPTTPPGGSTSGS